MKREVQTAKCNGCGKTHEVSREGWLVDSVIRERGQVVYVNGKPKREVRYQPWAHIPGHEGQNGKMCSGAGDLIHF